VTSDDRSGALAGVSKQTIERAAHALATISDEELNVLGDGFAVLLRLPGLDAPEVVRADAYGFSLDYVLVRPPEPLEFYGARLSRCRLAIRQALEFVELARSENEETRGDE
jgi:hypothetical protein